MDNDVFESLEMSSAECYSAKQLLSKDFLLPVYDIADLAERARVKGILCARAAELNIGPAIKAIFKELDTEDHKLERQYQSQQQNYTELPDSVVANPLVCNGWRVNSRGIWRTDTNELMSSTPFVPVARLKNLAEGTERIKLACLVDSHRANELVFPRSTLASANQIVRLSDYGLHVDSNNARPLVKYVSSMLAQNRDDIPCVDTVSSLGWYRNEFVPYSSSIEFDGDAEFASLSDSITTRGSFDAWHTLSLKIRQSLPVRLCLDASLASVLIEKVGALPFIFHLWGGTGTGKTVALMCAASIWGNPEHGKLVRSMNMTQNSMLSMAACLNNLPLFGDELQTIKQSGGTYDRIIMSCTEGIDRARMKGDELQRLRSWRCAFIFSGEETITKSNSGGGAKNRCIELELELPLFPGASGNLVANMVRQNYGHAGRKFIAHITTIQDLNTDFSDIVQRLLKVCPEATEKQASSMALILLADKIAAECLFSEERPLTVEDVAGYLSSYSEVDVSERAYQFIIDCIATNKNRFYSEYNIEIDHGEAWGEITDSGKTVLFNKTKLCDCLEAKGFVFDAVKKAWAAKKHLVPNSQGRYYNLTSVRGSRANFVRLALFDQDEEPETSDEMLPIF